MRRFATCLAIALVVWLLTPPEVRAAEEGPTPALLLDGRPFLECESESYVALTLARDAFWFKADEASLLAYPGLGAHDREAVGELFRRKASGELKNYLAFAGDRFKGCARRAGLALTLRETERLGGCQVPVDVLFVLLGQQEQGRDEAEGAAKARKAFAASSTQFPIDALVEEFAPVVYRNPGAGRALSRQAFARCAFPSDWVAWAGRPGRGALLAPGRGTTASARGPALARRALAGRLVECAGAAASRARMMRELGGEPATRELAMAQHYLQVACALDPKAPDGFGSQNEAQLNLFRQALARDKTTAIALRFRAMTDTLNACADEEDGSAEVIRSLTAAELRPCNFELTLD